MTDEKSLAELRRDIDRIDDSIQDLLWPRTDVVEEVRAYKHKRRVYRRGGFFRPSREIEILRRLLRRHHGRFPEKGIVQIWRTIIASHLAGQEHFSLAVYRPKSKDPCLGLAREHYGAIVPTAYAASIAAVLKKVADRTVSAGVIPVPRKKDDAWWRHLVDRFDGLQIVAGLPFVDFEKDAGDVQAVIVAPMAPEPSSEDRSFLAVESERGIGPARLAAAFAREKIASRSPILYFHGGGYVLGGIESHDAVLQFFAAEIGSKIFSLDYRLAPENKFPSSLQDANLALEWLGKKLSLPISEISLCGDSAGGHLSASLSTYRAINNLELPLSQCLIYPMTDPLCNSKSPVDFASGFLLSQKAMIWFWEQLMNSRENLTDPVFNLTIDPKVNLPKTLIITAGFDPLSDEGESYARLLDEIGNEVKQIHYPHLIHGFVNMTALKAARDATKDLLKTYKNFLK